VWNLVAEGEHLAKWFWRKESVCRPCFGSSSAGWRLRRKNGTLWGRRTPTVEAEWLSCWAAPHHNRNLENRFFRQDDTNNIGLYIIYMWAGIAQSVWRLATGRTVRDRIPVGARFSAPVHTHAGANPPSCIMGTGSFPGVKRPGRGADHPLHLTPRLQKE
jgi:hypothetical protein